MIELGLTSLLKYNLELIEGKAIGLITNLTGVNEKLDYNISLLIKDPKIRLKAIFSPEHGLWGAAQDAISVPSSQHNFVNIPIHSLYGNTIKPTSDMLKGLDALVFDIQDVGVRFYTYITTMALAMEACAENNLDFIVLDRPNPISGTMLEGNMLDPQFSSFVGYLPILLRHGMTIGELAKLFNERFNIGVDLHVAMMKDWKRDMWFDETGLHWVMPSPNMPTLDTATVYSGMCLFEGTNVSEGRGTTKPFEIIGAQWIDAYNLANDLNDMELLGVKFRPTYFVPNFSKHKDQQCGGVQVHVFDRKAFVPVRTALFMIDTIRKTYPNDFQLIENFDLLMGTDKVRLAFTDNQSVDDIISSWQDDLAEFSSIRSKYLLYT
jgi:uncharacterized protein YbbC (DUF1343 family)